MIEQGITRLEAISRMYERLFDEQHDKHRRFRIVALVSNVLTFAAGWLLAALLYGGTAQW